MPVKQQTPQTIEQISNTAKTFADVAGIIEGIAIAARADGFSSLEVTNFYQCQKAMEFISNYAAAVQNGLIEARRTRGDFSSPKPVSPARAKSAKKPAKKPSRRGHQTKTTDT